MATSGSDYQIPGSSSFSQPVSLDPSSLSHYQILGIRQGATHDEISNAYRQKARQYHPDKTGNDLTEEWMKKLNEAKSVLLSEKREQYDEKLADEGQGIVDPARLIPGGPRLSLQFLQFFNSCKISFERGFIKNLENFHIVLQNEFKGKTNDLPALPFTAKQPSGATTSRPTKHFAPTSTAHSPLTDVLDEMNSMLNEPQLNALLQTQNKQIQDILDMAKIPGTKTSLPIKDNLVPIMSFSNIPDKALASFSSLFTNSGGKAIPPRSAILDSLQSIVPYIAVKQPNTDEGQLQEKCGACAKKFGFFFETKHSCYNCKNSLCKHCPPKQALIPKLNPEKTIPLCSQCINWFTQSDIDEWTSSCFQFIQTGTVKSTKAAMGCLMVVLCLSDFSTKPIIRVARGLFHNGLPELAMPFVATVLNHSQDTKETLGAFVLSAQILKTLADESNSDPELQWNFLLAAKDSISSALEQASCLDSGAVEMPSHTTLEKDVCKSLHILKEKQEHIQECEVKMLCLEMETLWQKRECEEILALVLDEDSIISDSFLPTEDSMTTMALEEFVVPKCAFLDRMYDEDRCAIVFFRGLLKLLKKRVPEGLLDIEEAAYTGQHQEWLRNAVSDVVMSILNEDPSMLFPSDSFKEALKGKQLLKTDMFTDRFQVLFPKKHEITPPYSRNWPQLSVIGLNIRGHTKFEKAVYSQVQDGNWDEKDAAMAYVDYVGACDHPAEVAMCFLNAAMWFLKHLQASIVSSSLAEKYATKRLIVRCINVSLTMAYLHLHPGMQLHVSRLCLGIMMQTMQLIEGFATKEDGTLVSRLLDLILYNCRFCPIWHFPTTPLSEAVLLNIKARRFHEDFLLALQNVDANKLPMKQSELLYQIYENNLRYTCPLADPAAARTRAMETLLREKGWTWNDVADRMTSPLSRRDEEGWLIRQPTLGVDMSLNYAELKGFSFNLDSENPSIEIIAIKADASRGRVGLLSMKDIQTVLQLDPSELYPISFSLDPPEEHHRFHPFQQLRYATEKLQKTPLLHTLFETDYLMKSFSVGSEVSAKPPFNQRPCKEGLTKNLPPHLQEAVKPVSERGNTLSDINRFWIQAEELVYEPNQNGSKVTIRVGDLKMKICSHPLLPGPDGKLQDTEDENDPDSPEANFAKDLTIHYNELGLHFPMFARLRELAKLQLLGVMLRNLLDDMKSKAEGKGVEVPSDLLTEIQQKEYQQYQTQVSGILRNLDQEIGVWPSADDYSNVSSLTQEIMDSLPYHIKSQASYSDIRPHAVDVLRKRDDSALSQVTDGLMQLCKHTISRSSLQVEVHRWLSNRNSLATINLKNLICWYIPLTTEDELKRQIIDFHREKYTAFKKEVDKLTDAPPNPDENPCKWVPAALLEEENIGSTRLCYGGVLIAPNIKTGRVPYLPSSHFCTDPVRRTHVPPFLNPARNPFHYTLSDGLGNGMYNLIPTAECKLKLDFGSAYWFTDPEPESFQNQSAKKPEPFHAPVTLSVPADDTGSSGGNGFGVSVRSRISAVKHTPKASEHKPILHTFRTVFVSESNHTGTKCGVATGGDSGIEYAYGRRGWSGSGRRREWGGYGFGGGGGSRNHGNKRATYAVGAVALLLAKSAQTDTDEHMKESRAKSNKLELPYWLEPTRNNITAPNGQPITLSYCTADEYTTRTSNVVYGIYSAKTGILLYVGKTKGEFRKRIQAHMRDIRNGKKTTDLVRYFNTEGRSVDDVRVVVLEKVPPSDPEDLSRREMENVLKYETKTQGLNMRNPIDMKKYEGPITSILHATRSTKLKHKKQTGI